MVKEAEGAAAQEVQNTFRARIQHLQVVQHLGPNMGLAGASSSVKVRAALLNYNDWDYYAGVGG